MIENEFYSRAVHGPYETFNIGDLVLEDGGTMRQCKLAYASFGKLTSKERHGYRTTAVSADPTAEAYR
jgi:homoserine acetyltransferase